MFNNGISDYFLFILKLVRTEQDRQEDVHLRSIKVKKSNERRKNIQIEKRLTDKKIVKDKRTVV